MIVVRDGDARPSLGTRSVVALGVFDGLHRGHQRLIAKVVELARRHDATATIATFDPHPAEVLEPVHAPRLLATLDQRLEGLEALGVAAVRIVTFDHALALESASSFIERVLVGELAATVVVVGEDFRFGHARTGDVGLLRTRGEALGFEVLASPLYGDAERWSSSAIRRRLEVGDLDGANAMLARPFTLRGTVGHGDARGQSLGFATANLLTAPRQQLPAAGVYAGAARAPNGEWWPAAVSVGTRPQFHEAGELLVEAHLVGFAANLYGSTLSVAFLARLRAQATYADVDELVVQMSRDVSQTLEMYRKFSPSSSVLLG